MANFIEEVDEEVRRERMEKLWKRWSPVAIGAVVAIPLPFVGPIIGAIVGGGIGYFTADKQSR